MPQHLPLVDHLVHRGSPGNLQQIEASSAPKPAPHPVLPAGPSHSLTLCLGMCAGEIRRSAGQSPNAPPARGETVEWQSDAKICKDMQSALISAFQNLPRKCGQNAGGMAILNREFPLVQHLVLSVAVTSGVGREPFLRCPGRERHGSL